MWHGCCARVSLAEALLRQHVDGVARASSAGTKSGSIAPSLVLLTMLAPISRTARLRDQLGLGDEVNSESRTATTRAAQLAMYSSSRRLHLRTSSVSAPQLVPRTLGSQPIRPAVQSGQPCRCAGEARRRGVGRRGRHALSGSSRDQGQERKREKLGLGAGQGQGGTRR